MKLSPVFPDTSPYYTFRAVGNVNSDSNYGSVAAFDAVQDTLDLSREGRTVLEATRDLDPAARQEYLEILARLLKSGVAGTETLRIHERPYTSFAGTGFADPRIAGAPLYRSRR